MHFVSDLLNRQGSVLKQYFNFHYYDLIDQLLGRLMRRPAHDGGKITGRDTELVRIERNLTLFDTIIVYQKNKTMKQLHLPVGSRGTLAADLTLNLIVKLQHNILQPISHDRLSEHITPILIGVIHYFEPSGQSGSHPFVYLRNGIFLQKAEKRGPQPKSGLPEQVGREGAEPHREVVRRIIEHQYATGQ